VTDQDNEALLRKARLDLALGRHAEAAEAFERALVGGGGTARDCFDFGVLLEGRQRLLDAVTWFERAAAKDPKLFEPHLNLGRARVRVGESSAAVVDFDAALARRAGLDAVSDRLLALNYVPELSEADVAEEHFRQGAAFGKEIRSPDDFETLRQESSEAPIRIGILSPDLRSHPIGWFLRPLLPRLSAMGFELLAYSSTPIPDSVTSDLRPACSAWRECLGVPDSRVESLVLADRPHVLLDMSGHTARNRMTLTARRLAPVQIQWIGYANTTAVSAVDFTIGDPIETPPHAHRFFSESIVTMPDAYACYEAPPGLGAAGPLPCLTRGSVTFGSLNNPSKIHPNVLEVWAKIIRDVPKSRLLLRYQTYSDPKLRDRYLRFFEERGIDPGRIEMIAGGTPQEAIATYEAIDIALDTFPYSGCTTTCESIARGVPVVAMRGRGFPGRHSASFLSNASLADWVNEDLDRYAEMAIERANDPSRLATLRRRLPAELASTPLCDADRFTAHLARALRHIVQRWRDGEPPAAFEVASID